MSDSVLPTSPEPNGVITFAAPMTQEQIDCFQMGWDLAQTTEFNKVVLKKRGFLGNTIAVTFERLALVTTQSKDGQ